MFSNGPRASLRTLSHIRPHIRYGRRGSTVRPIHSQSYASSTTGRLGITGGVLALFGGVLAYQAFARPSLKLDAQLPIQEKKSKIVQNEPITRFWERPGVFLWGSNSGRVAAPDSDENFIKAPRRVPFFDGYVLRDLHISHDMGVAVLENGDLMQWGKGYAPDCRAPVVTFGGKDIIKAGLSEDRIVALSSSGKVYSIPFSKEEQELFAKPTETSGLPFWQSTSESKTSYRDLTPPKEKVVDIAVGLEHTVMLTSRGKVFTAASASYSFPLRGQLGIAGMSWESKPKPYDTPQEVDDLSQFKITQIAAGSYHSVAADKDGKIFVWGDNTKGQLGVEFTEDSIPKPKLIPRRAFYKDEGVKPKLQQIFAGGYNTYFTMETYTPDEDLKKPATRTYDVFACGHGLHGSLGTGFYVHAQAAPQKIKSISGLTEYSEAKAGLVPIDTLYLTVGGSHTAVVMSNQQNAGPGAIDFGNDILFFGGNEFYQLGNGKRTNQNVPAYISPIDAGSGKKSEDRFQVVPGKKIKFLDQNSKIRSVKIEQRVVAGRGLTGCYAKTA
ncbi:hypothetical protein TWF730_000489 [Orbilia blumenaviensis]|uniref:Uncharacterized protein n=1 Tax=Orbilia blumenaviensis TaxID=1796055 RepID=A0AAV9VM18_9PEZI